MAAIYRRVFCRPAGLTAEQLARWEQALAGAVALQRQLEASSPYILQLLGDLEPSEYGFSVRHEPAEPLALRVFEAQAPTSSPAELLRTAAALLDALRAFHESRRERPPVHGGVCPGILLVTGDGIPKVTDFGIAPAYAALDKEIYKNLAVRTPGDETPDQRITAVWEALRANVSDRDDRLAAFIDPDKYESGRYQAFEPPSDVLAAGAVLHLLAEHRHPYLYDDAEAHRNIDVLEFMLPLSVPTRVRRADLLKSEDAAIREWCELVAQMVDRSPEKRPPAGRAVQQLPRINLEDIFQARLESIARSLESSQVQWQVLLEALRPLAGGESSPASVREQARAMVELCEAALLSETAEWTQAEPLLDRALQRSGLPEAAVRHARTLQERLQTSLAAVRELQSARTIVEDASGTPMERDARLAQAAGRLAALSTDRLFAPLRRELTTETRRIEELRQSLSQELGELAARAEAWLAEASDLRERQDWEGLQAALQRPPAYLPSAVQAGAEQLRVALRAHEDELEARRRLRVELQRCLSEAEALLAQGELIEAQERAGRLQRPGVDEDLSQRAAELLAKIQQAAQERAAHEAELLRERARLDESLHDAMKAFADEDPAGLQDARRLCQSVLESELATAAQRESCELLNQQIRRRLDELEHAALGELETLQRQESRLVEARELLAAKSVLEASTLAAELAASKFPHIREQAAGLVEECNARLEARRTELRDQLDAADALFASGELDEALAVASRVWEDRASDEHLLARAHTRMSEAEAELARIADLRAQAERELNDALAALAQARVIEAREHFTRARASGHLASEHRAQLDLALVSMPGIEAASELLDHEDFPGALEASLHVQADSSFELVRTAAGLLAARARAGMAESLVKGIEKHLERRAALEEGSGQPETLSPDESLGDASPAWLRSRVGQFETFVQSCATIDRPAREPRLAPGTRLGGKYEIQEFLGRGGMGEVYRAVDLKLKREVALKIAPPQASNAGLAAALQNEAEAIASLSHPHIVHINSFDVIDGRPCFDTNYIRGKDLAAFAGESGTGALAPMQAVTTLIPICEALAYAHERGVLHRDIKPQNIYVGSQPGEGPWLIDFGLARIRSICDQRELEGLCGTPGYVAPEVIRSLGRDADPRSDVFALGCVLFVLLSGQVPFRTRGGKSGAPASPSRILLQTLRCQVDPLSTLSPHAPEPLRQICRKAMAADPADRFQTAGEMAQALRNFHQELLAGEARSELKAAQARFDQRRRETPAELEDLDAAAALAEQAARRRIEPVQAEAAQLAAGIEAARQEITAAITGGRQQMEAAAAAFTARQYRAALNAARAVAANPYVPDVHAAAQEIQTAAASALGAQRRRRLGVAGIGTVGALCIVGAVLLWPRFFVSAKPGAPGRVVVDPPVKPLKPPADTDPSVQPQPPVEPPPPVQYAIAIEPPTGPIKERQSLSLEVRWREPASPPAGVTYQWYRAEQDKRSPIAGANAGTLTRPGVTPQDAGQYICVARLDGRDIAEASVRLQVAALQQHQVLLDASGTMELDAEQERALTARLEPAAPASFEWFRINPPGEPQPVGAANPLRVKGSQPGTYFCRAKADDGQWESARITIALKPPAPQPEVTPPPAPARVIAFACEPAGEFVWPPTQIQCTVELDKPAALESAAVRTGNCRLAAPLGAAPAQKHTFTLTPTGKDGDKVTVQLADSPGKLLLAPDLRTRSVTYTIPEPPALDLTPVDASATLDASGTFTAARLPVVIELGPAAAGIAADAVQVEPADTLKSLEQTRLTLAHPTRDTLTVTVRAGALRSPSGRPNEEKRFVVNIPAEEPSLQSGLPGAGAALKTLENLTLRFEKNVTAAAGALIIGGKEVPASVQGNIVSFELTRLTDLSGKVEARLDPTKITNAFQRPLKLPEPQTRWSYMLPSPAYVKWMQSRRALEAQLAGLASGPLGDKGALMLAAFGACKWGQTVPAQSMVDWTAKLRDPAEGLSARGRGIQSSIFAEYLWGEDVHVLCWTSRQPDQVDYVNLGKADTLLAELRSKGAARGQRLLQPVLDRLKSAAQLLDATTPTLGIALGLDGPLWLLHVDDLPIQRMTFDPALRLFKVKVTDRGSQQAIVAWNAPIACLSDLCPSKEDPDGLWYTAIWTMISLAPAPAAADLATLCAPGLQLPEGQSVQFDSLRGTARGRLMRLANQSGRAVIGALGEEDAGFAGPRILDPAGAFALIADPVR